jgi:predicted kinase
MKYLLLLNGTFAAGKSTTAKILSERDDSLEICDWDVPEVNDLSIIDIAERKKTRWIRLQELCNRSLSDGYSVVIPNTITGTDMHSALKDLAVSNSAKFIHIALMIPEHLIATRLSQREYNGSITDESTSRTYSELQKLIMNDDITVIDSSVNTPDKVASSIQHTLDSLTHD